MVSFSPKPAQWLLFPILIGMIPVAAYFSNPFPTKVWNEPSRTLLIDDEIIPSNISYMITTLFEGVKQGGRTQNVSCSFVEYLAIRGATNF